MLDGYEVGSTYWSSKDLYNIYTDMLLIGTSA